MRRRAAGCRNQYELTNRAVAAYPIQSTIVTPPFLGRRGLQPRLGVECVLKDGRPGRTSVAEPAFQGAAAGAASVWRIVRRAVRALSHSCRTSPEDSNSA